MGGGKHLEFYLPKEVAMVSLQAAIVYINWFLLYPAFFKKGRYISYGVVGVVLVYACFTISFTWIRAVLTGFNYFFSNIPIPDFPPIRFRYLFWEFLSSSAPYSLAFVISLAVKIFHESDKNKKLAKVLQMEKAQTEIQYLRAQINPHFLFNSLNNIHALILKDKDQAAEYTLLLSELLRYMLYEVKKDKTALENELQCLQNYFSLVQLKKREVYNNMFTQDIQNPKSPIVPLLLTSMVENGIKHSGIEFDSKAWLNLHIHEENNRIKVLMKNSISLSVNGKKEGIGLQNLKKRLQINYPNQYQFDFEIDGQTAVTQLIIKLKV